MYKELSVFNKKISLFLLPLMAVSLLQANDPFFDDPFGDDIFKEMRQMQKDMDRIFERMHKRMEERTQPWNYPNRQGLISSNPMVMQSALVDKGAYYEYDTQIPEGKNNQVNISIEDGVLHFKAKVDTVRETKDPNINMQQHYVSMIQRSETLPQDADPSSLKSEYKNGVLVLTLQKKKHLKHPLLKEDKKERPKPVQETSKEEEKETNRTKVRVPHTSTHV